MHGPVVRQVVWSPWPVVQWSPQCCGSCRPVAPHESHSRAGFGLHSTWDRTRGLMFCLVEEIERQDPSQDGISVFSLNPRFCPGEWGGGQNLLHNACQGLVARSLVSVCQNGSEWLCQSCRIVAGSAVLLAVLVPGPSISEFSILSQHGSRPVQLRACAVLDLPLPSRDRILQMSS